MLQSVILLIKRSERDTHLNPFHDPDHPNRFQHVLQSRVGIRLVFLPCHSITSTKKKKKQILVIN